MAAEVGSAAVTVWPSARGFGRKLQGQIGGDLDRSGKDSGRRFGGTFVKASAGPLRSVLSVGGPLAAGLATIGAVKVFGRFIGEARESARIGRLTAQVIKTTGGAAKVTAGQVGGLAERISNLTGVDDEAIQAGANLLLTFTKVRDEVGKGNDVFSQAVARSNDMSVALGTDMKSASLQVGKALNDPIRGVTALTRAGVSFTQQQRDQIKTLVESGDTLGAQKIILSELQTQFGGAAKAAADPMQRLGVIVGNLGERVGTALLPAIDGFANFIIGKAIPAGERFAKFITGRVVPAVKLLGAFIGAKVIPPLARFGGFVTGTVLPALVRLGGFLSKNLGPAFSAIGEFITSRVLPAVRGLAVRFQEVSPTLAKVGLFVAKVAGGLAALAIIIIGKVVPVILRFAGPVLTFMFAAVGKKIGIIAGFIRIVSSIVGVVVRVAVGIGRFVTGAVAAFGRFKTRVGELIGNVVTFVRELPGKAVAALSSLGRKMLSAARTGFGELKAGAKEKALALMEFVKGIPGRIVRAIGNLGSLLLQAGRDLIGGLIRGITGSNYGGMANAGRDAVRSITSAMRDEANAHSPSKVTERIGQDIADGLAVGLLSRRGGLRVVAGATVDVIPQAMRPVARPVAAGSAASGTAAGVGSLGPALDRLNRLLASLEKHPLRATIDGPGAARYFDRQLGRA